MTLFVCLSSAAHADLITATHVILTATPNQNEVIYTVKGQPNVYFYVSYFANDHESEQVKVTMAQASAVKGQVHMTYESIPNEVGCETILANSGKKCVAHRIQSAGMIVE